MSGASLAQLRRAIMDVDRELVALLNRRAGISLAVGELKRAAGQGGVFRPGREAAIYRHLEGISQGTLPARHLRAIYREILASSRQLQGPERVAYTGPEGSPCHAAAKRLLGSLADFQPKAGPEEVLRAVRDGTCDLGVLPLESARPPLHPGLRILCEEHGAGGEAIGDNGAGKEKAGGEEDDDGRAVRHVILSRSPE